MDRALAQRYGAPYVHMVAFAIDIDRVRELDPEDGSLPFGWEVFLVECFLREMFESSVTENAATLVEDACLAVLELPRALPGRLAPFGSQLPFAVYTAVARGFLPESLGSCFRAWKKAPTDLLQELRAMEQETGTRESLLRYCLGAEVQPALVPPVRAALERLLTWVPQTRASEDET